MVECDYLIIGGGDTGINLAQSLNKLNKSIVLVESYKLGGGSLNNVLIPKKEFYREAKNFSYIIKYFSEHGDITNRLYEAKKMVLTKINNDINGKYKDLLANAAKLAYLKILFGNAILLSKNTASVNIENKKIIIKYKKCLLCVGKDFIYPQHINGLETIAYLTKYTIFRLVETPDHLAIIGLTEESMEVAMFYSQLGVEVSIFEKKSKSQVLPNIDRTMASFIINKALLNYVSIHFETQIDNLQCKEGQITLFAKNNSVFKSSHLYIHIDERFDIYNETIKKVKIRSVSEGIKVDNQSRTSNTNIYAFGSCTNKNDSKKVVKAKILSFVDLETKENNNKYKTISTQLIINTANLISYKSQQEDIGRLITFEMEYFLDSIGVGLSELKAIGKYGPKVKVVLLVNKRKSEFLKLIYFTSSKRLVGYWATTYFKTHFHSLLGFGMISKSNTLTIIDIIQSQIGEFEKRIT
jgi:pyruvate/2-oxoglutarate dehydrogenase complex dihydrolipoamide dehydrogenase (E3) component